MKLTKNITLIGIAGAIGVASLIGVGASAQSFNNESIIEKLANKFNVSQEEVQSVFEEAKTERHADREAKASERLQALVDDGTITGDQKITIEAKKAELQEQRESTRTELNQWAEDNGIDPKFVARGHHNSNKLDRAVENGDLTTEQQSAIETKLSELHAQRESQQSELKAWAEENNIDLQYLRGKVGNHKGPAKHHSGPANDDSLAED